MYLNSQQNLPSLAKLESLERLNTIQMEGNPVWSLPDYSNYVVSALPHLKVLDQQEITGDLRANAAKWKTSQATVNQNKNLSLDIIRPHYLVTKVRFLLFRLRHHPT